MPIRILIAEDDAYLRALFAKAFRGSTFEVITASNGDETVNHLNKQLPDVLIMDIGLPGPSGLDIARYVRRHQQYARKHNPVKIILVTGDVRAKNSPEALLADAFLLKPVTVKELVTLADKLAQQSIAATA